MKATEPPLVLGSFESDIHRRHRDERKSPSLLLRFRVRDDREIRLGPSVNIRENTRRNVYEGDIKRAVERGKIYFYVRFRFRFDVFRCSAAFGLWNTDDA